MPSHSKKQGHSHTCIIMCVCAHSTVLPGLSQPCGHNPAASVCSIYTVYREILASTKTFFTKFGEQCSTHVGVVYISVTLEPGDPRN